MGNSRGLEGGISLANDGPAQRVMRPKTDRIEFLEKWKR